METSQSSKKIPAKDGSLKSSGLPFGRNLVALALVVFALTLSSVSIFGAFAKSGSQSISTETQTDQLGGVSAVGMATDLLFLRRTVGSPTAVFNSSSVTVATNVLSVTCTTNPVVTSNADSGAGSLRQAIVDACDASAITFSSLFNSAETITLTSQLLIDKSLTITGPGANFLTISGNNAVPVLRISNVNTTVTISGLTIANGNATVADAASGGGISNSATLNIIDSTISGNSVINTCNGPLCVGGASGGGIYNTGTINVLRSTISGNSALISAHGLQADGGGISNKGTLTITNSTVANNSATGTSGGACGGGVSNNGGLNITKSTIAGNFAGGGTGGNGGGVCVGQSSTPIVTNSIIANNTGPLFAESGPDVKGTFTSNGYNLIGKGDGSTGFTNAVNNDQVGTVATPINPLLGTLSNNGGTTQTIALMPGSPAIDKGNALIGIMVDQRGLTRPVDLSSYANPVGGDGSDIGAFEVQIGTPDHLKFNVQPSDTAAGSTITPAVSVTILDGSNNLTTSTANVAVAIGTNPSAGVLGGTTTRAAVNGTATFNDLSINKKGPGYTLIASGPVPDTTSNAFDVTCSIITLAPSSLPNGTLGFAYANNVTASGETGPFSFAVTSGSVPTGLTFNSNGTWSGTQTAIGLFNFTIMATAANGCVGSQAYAVSVSALTISGRVTKGGNAFPGVTITLSGGQSNSTVTDGNGNYSFGDIAGNANYTVTPSRSNNTFAPANATFNNLQGNATANFAGTLINYNISGRVAVGSSGLSGVTITLSGDQSGSAITDINGNYSFLNLAGDGNYNLTPSRTGYTFSPTSRSFATLSANQTLADFAAFLKISGQIKNSSNVPLSNVVVVLNGTTSATEVSDGNGNFSFAGLTVGGNYVVTPARTNYSFSPSLRTFTNVSTPQTADFVGTLANYTISGRVADSGNTGISGVLISLSGSQTATAMTAANGSYSFTVPGDGNYTITPSSQDYAFTPLNTTFNMLSQNQSAANFNASLIPPQLILDLSGPDPEQVAAIDSLLFLRDPFTVVSGAPDPFFSGPDRNTRVIVFAGHLQLDPGETSASVVVNLVDSNGQSYDIAAEDVRSAPNVSFMQIVFRLPDNLPAGTCTIKVRAHGQVSNSGTLRIRM